MKSPFITTLNIPDKKESVTSYLACVHSEKYASLLKDIQNLLSPIEMSYFSGLQHERRRLSYLLGRYAAKQVVASYLKETDLTEIEIASGCFNQPVVRHLSVDTPHVTISHCDCIAVAVAFCPAQIIGVDIEYIARDRLSVYQSQLTAKEKHYAVNRFQDSVAGSVCLWTVKEALSKALKCGFMVPFDILEVEQLDCLNDRSYVSFFKYFKQYKCISFITNPYVLSIALPGNTLLNNSIDSLIACFHELSENNDEVQIVLSTENRKTYG